MMFGKVLLLATYLLVALYCKTAAGAEESDSSVVPLARLFLHKVYITISFLVLVELMLVYVVFIQ